MNRTDLVSSFLHPHPQTMETKRNKPQSEQKQQTRKTCQNQDISCPLQLQIQHPGENSIEKYSFPKSGTCLLQKHLNHFQSREAKHTSLFH